MYKRFLPTLLFLAIPLIVFSQIKQDHIVKDGTVIQGTIVSGKGFNANEIYFKKDDETKKYKPTEIEGYYFSKIDKTFVSRKTKDSEYFFFEVGKGDNEGKLILLEDGKKNNYIDFGQDYIYKINKRGLIKKSSKKELRNLVLLNCSSKDFNYRIAKNSKRRLKKLLIEHGDCNEKEIGFFRFGLLLGLDGSSYRNTYFAQGNTFSSSWSFGVSAEIPFNIKGNLTLLTELRWRSFSYSNFGKPYNDNVRGNGVNIYKDHEYLVAASSIEVPIMVRYYLTNPKIPLFINLGATYSHFYKMKDLAYEMNEDELTGNIAFIQLFPDRDFIYTRNWGLLAGVGYRYHLTKRLALNTELRVKSNINSTTFENQYKQKGIELIVGISF